MEIDCEHYCSAAIHPVAAQLKVAISRLSDGSFGGKLKFDNGQERNQFSEVDSKLCVLDLWGWRFRASDPVGALRLEGFVSWCGKGDRL
jgi:hypothetical protein